jgi:hypothetical protein
MTTVTSSGDGNVTESDPLLSPRSQQSKYYFLNKQDESYQGGSTSAVKDGDGSLVVEGAPKGSNDDEFAPRLVVHKVRRSRLFLCRFSCLWNPMQDLFLSFMNDSYPS